MLSRLLTLKSLLLLMKQTPKSLIWYAKATLILPFLKIPIFLFLDVPFLSLSSRKVENANSLISLKSKTPMRTKTPIVLLFLIKHLNKLLVWSLNNLWKCASFQAVTILLVFRALVLKQLRRWYTKDAQPISHLLLYVKIKPGLKKYPRTISNNLKK